MEASTIAAFALGWSALLEPRASGPATIAPAIAHAVESSPDALREAALLTAIAWHESKFVVDAVSAKDDPVRSCGPWQISVEWLPCGAPLEKQAAKALELVRDSLDRCGDLTEYTSGECGAGRLEATARQRTAERLIERHVRGHFLCPQAGTVERHRKHDSDDRAMARSSNPIQ